MVHENSEKDCIYTVYSGDLEELAEEVTEFCVSEYGEQCEFSEIEIQRNHPDGNYWPVHEFSSFEERSVKAIKNHLKTRRDAVKVRFGDEDEKLELLICRARNTARLARRVKKEHREQFNEDDLVVLAVEQENGVLNKAREMFKELE